MLRQKVKSFQINKIKHNIKYKTFSESNGSNPSSYEYNFISLFKIRTYIAFKFNTKPFTNKIFELIVISFFFNLLAISL